MNGIVPVPEENDATSGTLQDEIDKYNEQFIREPDYIYTVWAIHQPTGGAMEMFHSVDRATAEQYCRNGYLTPGGTVMTRSEIILDMRR